MNEHDEREDYDDEPWRSRAVSGRLIKLPADLMWACGWFQRAVSLYSLFVAGQFVFIALTEESRPDVRSWLASAGCLVLATVGLVVSRFIIRGAKAMGQARDYSRAVLAACLTVASVPCLASFPYTVPIGIWALLVLDRPDVRAHFKAARHSDNVSQDGR